MANTGSFDGTLAIGSDTIKAISLAINVVSQAHTIFKKGRRTIAASEGIFTLEIGDISTLALIWLQVVKASDETIPWPIGVNFIISAADENVGLTTDLFKICNPKDQVDVTGIKITGGTVDTILNYVVAGD